MCGINGIYAYHSAAPRVIREELLRSREAQLSRGPDGSGLWIDKNRGIGLAHRRLAIIDLSERGSQPMADKDNRLHITFNGEIYNYKEIRRELQSDGISFYSDSDTEVLLALYQRDGTAMVERLRGMFAFAIWDSRHNGLFLARDPYGIKPLYYSDNGHTLRFASQVKALMAGGAISSELDPAGVAGFLMWGSVPEPITIQRDIQLLQAGHTLWVDSSGNHQPQCYWNLAQTISTATMQAQTLSPDEARESACIALRSSVQAHMVADVPVATFLSAGLDSSTVTGLARSLSNHPLSTLTLSFPEFVGTANDEAPLAASIAQHLDVSNQLTLIDSSEFETEFPRFLTAMDQPSLDGINTWFISKAAVEAGFKVALSGLGGDELLGGYASFRTIPQTVANCRRWHRWPGVARSGRFLQQHLIGPVLNKPVNETGRLDLCNSYFGAYRLARGVMMPWDLSIILDKDFADQGLRRLDELKVE
jgi:asparagine synthase (glutamine-hydrolysing)